MSARSRARSIIKRCKFHSVKIDDNINSVDNMEKFLISNGFDDSLGVCLVDKSKGYTPTNIVFSKMKTWCRSREDDHGTSRYKGVGWYKSLNKWRARIKVNGKHKHLGYFESEDDAGKEYNKYAIKYFGTLAKINDINKGRL